MPDPISPDAVPPNDHMRNIPLGYLRAFLTLLVVLHHALLAYVRFAPPWQPPLDASLVWTAFPIVDGRRWPGADLIVSFNDSFFMSLMFLVSGAFVWPSLLRKGGGRFLRDRALRLGVPFLVAVAVLAPLAYYPTWLASAHAGSFWRRWLALGVWPAGPAWFLWLLLAFAGLAALMFRIATGLEMAFGRIAGRLGERPAVFCLALLCASALAYMPMAAVFDPSRWVKYGPFFVQVSRVPHYLLYFLVGASIGAYGAPRGLLQVDGRLARRWPLWLLLAIAAFALSLGTLVTILGTLAHGGPGPWLASFGNFTFVLTCAASSFAFLALFVRFARKARGMLDRLCANAYGIYLLHYVCVTWLQLALLHEPWPGVAKALLVFAGAVALSWSLSGALRRIPVVARIV